MNTETQVVKMNLAELTALVIEQGKMIVELQSKVEPKRNEAQREMTDDDARRVITGDLSSQKHKDAAGTLGLSYGQIYSARLEFTFKHIHKEMKDANIANPWTKK